MTVATQVVNARSPTGLAAAPSALSSGGSAAVGSAATCRCQPRHRRRAAVRQCWSVEAFSTASQADENVFTRCQQGDRNGFTRTAKPALTCGAVGAAADAPTAADDASMLYKWALVEASTVWWGSRADSSRGVLLIAGRAEPYRRQPRFPQQRLRTGARVPAVFTGSHARSAFQLLRCSAKSAARTAPARVVSGGHDRRERGASRRVLIAVVLDSGACDVPSHARAQL